MASESANVVLQDLPAGVLRQVLGFVSAKDVVAVICTCKSLREMASEDVVWRPKFMKWHHRSTRWQTDERPWIAKYGARKEVFERFSSLRTYFASEIGAGSLVRSMLTI